VLADGFQDDARIDVYRLVIKALRELEAPHIRVLELMASAGGIDKAYVQTALPELSDGLDPIFAVLERTGCLARSDGRGGVRSCIGCLIRDGSSMVGKISTLQSTSGRLAATTG
jgi:hypothetical protein